MGHPSTPRFRTFHALRIKGFAGADTLVEMTSLALGEVDDHLGGLRDDGHSVFRENRALWQLTPDGREAHLGALRADLDGLDVGAAFADAYPAFLEMNAEFKELCGDWQLRDGDPNDHSDAGYDADVIGRLGELHQRAHPVVGAFGASVERFDPYASRLAGVLQRLRSGETNLFTGVMCGSYHDVWMELHEDLILTQGIDRLAEGSF